MSTSSPAPTYAGERLGLPPEGRGSASGWLRRVLALFVDWIASQLVAGLVAGPSVSGAHDWRIFVPLLVFWLEGSLLTALAGGSFGQLVTRVAVVRVDGKPVSLFVALLRTLLICLVVPPVIYNRDRRGLHDLATKTVTILR